VPAFALERIPATRLGPANTAFSAAGDLLERRAAEVLQENSLADGAHLVRLLEFEPRDYGV
jgi:hypothetical protein